MEQRPPAHPYRLALFDFDGTLADSFPWFLAEFDGLVARFGLNRLDPAALAALLSCPAAEIMARLGVRRWQVPALARDLRRRKARDAATIPLFAGVPELLAELDARGVTLAIVSSDTEANVRRTLGPALAGRVARFACASALFGKARRMRRVLAACRCEPERALAIGDEIRDLDAARACGVDFGAVAWGYTAPAALFARQPDRMFERVEAIADAFPAPA